MSLSRLNRIVMLGILPFNYGMTYEDCLKFYDENHEKLPDFCPTDPRSWSPELVDKVNKKAQDDEELVKKLMAMTDDEFNAELDKRIAELETENDDRT